MIYRVDFPLTPEEIQSLEDSMTEPECKLFRSMEINSHDDISSSGHVISYMIGDEAEFKIVFSFLRDKSIRYKCVDIERDVLMGEYDFQGTPIDEDIDDFVKSNLTVDIILDKINIKGLESLSILDKSVLESI